MARSGKRSRFFLKEWHKAIREWEYLVHETKKKVFFRFLLVLSLVCVYFFYVAHKFGGREGLLVTMLTWSFFVFCTPVADAGILIDFPLRLLTKVRMLYSEMIVWVFAASINLYTFFFAYGTYDKTIILQLFHHILYQPWPFWLIILLSAAGTFLSIIFADELLDVVAEHHRRIHQKHHMKLKMVIMAVVIVLVFILYDFLLKRVGIEIPLL